LADVTPSAQILHRGRSVVGNEAAAALRENAAIARQSRIKGG
jgi:hypothetical protein